MLDHSRLVGILYVRECMRSALVAYQKAVALREIAGIVRTRQHLDQTTVAVLAAACRNTLADDAAAGITADMYHLRTGISLLEVIGNCHRIELRRRIVSLEDSGRIFPCDRRTGLDLCP